MIFRSGYAPASPSATVSVTALAAALKASSTTNKFTTIDDAFSPNWDLRGAKDRAIYVKASGADSGWKRFAVGTNTSTVLMDFIQDKNFDFNWSKLLRVLTAGSGMIAATPIILANGSKAMNIDVDKVVDLSLNYTAVSTDHRKSFSQWYNGDDSV